MDANEHEGPSHGWLSLLTILAKIGLLLAIAELIVRGPFFANYVAPRAGLGAFSLLRDHTAGQNLRIIMDLVESDTAAGVRIGFVGDSTMETVGPEKQEIPYLVAEDLRRLVPQLEAQPIHAGVVGLFGSDAAVMAAKLSARGTDVLVYGASLRAFPREIPPGLRSPVRRQVSPSDVLRLVRRGGGSWLFANFSGDELFDGALQSTWATYAYRLNLRQALWEVSVRPALVALGVPTKSFAPEGLPPLRTAADDRTAPYEWTWKDYDMDNGNWEGLDLFARICRDDLAGRCLIYAGPINTVRRDKLAEPLLYDAYLQQLRATTTAYGLQFRDFTDALEGVDFRESKLNRFGRDPIHPNEQGRRKLARLIAQALPPILPLEPTRLTNN